MTRRMLITRPKGQADAFAAGVASLGWAPVLAPLTEIVPRADAPLPDDARTLLFTSANGVRAFADRVTVRGQRALCVGDRTAEIAHGFGFDAVSARGTVDDLLALAVCEGQAPFLHIRGAHTKGDLAARLREGGHAAAEAILYDQCAVALSREHLDGLEVGAISAVSLFSPRASRLFLAQTAGKIRTELSVFCLSAAVATPMQDAGFSQVFRAETPDMEALLTCIRSHVLGRG